MCPRYTLSRRSIWLEHNQCRSLSYFPAQTQHRPTFVLTAREATWEALIPLFRPDFQHESGISLFIMRAGPSYAALTDRLAPPSSSRPHTMIWPLYHMARARVCRGGCPNEILRSNSLQQLAAFPDMSLNELAGIANQFLLGANQE